MERVFRCTFAYDGVWLSKMQLVSKFNAGSRSSWPVMSRYANWTWQRQCGYIQHVLSPHSSESPVRNLIRRGHNRSYRTKAGCSSAYITPWPKAPITPEDCRAEHKACSLSYVSWQAVRCALGELGYSGTVSSSIFTCRAGGYHWWYNY